MDFAITLLWPNWTMSHRGGRAPSLGDATTGRGAATRATTGEGEHCPRAATGEGERCPRAAAILQWRGAVPGPPQGRGAAARAVTWEGRHRSSHRRGGRASLSGTEVGMKDATLFQ
jgi:hypothetical protein